VSETRPITRTGAPSRRSSAGRQGVVRHHLDPGEIVLRRTLITQDAAVPGRACGSAWCGVVGRQAITGRRRRT
jgi:hypothetical protein